MSKVVNKVAGFDEIQPSFSSNNKTISLLGDSVTIECSWATGGTHVEDGTPTDGIQLYPNGYWAWAGALLGQRLRLINVVASGGWTTADGLANVGSVISKSPGFCLVMLGLNDVNNAVSSATAFANISGICDRLIDNGIGVFLALPGPSTGMDTAAEQLVFSTLSGLYSEYAMNTPGIIAIDAWKGLMDESVTTVQADPVLLSALRIDGSHPNNVGCMAMGENIYRQISQHIPEQNILGNHQLGYGFGSKNSNMIFAAAGTLAGAGITGVAPTGWTITGTNVTGVAYEVTRKQAGTAWQATTAHAVGVVVVPTTWNVATNLESEGFVCESIAGTGTSSGTEPVWPDMVGSTITDNAGANQIVWRRIRLDNASGSWAQVAVSTTSAADTNVLFTSSTITLAESGFAVGDRVIGYAEFEFDAAPTSMRGVKVELQIQRSSTWANISAMHSSGTDEAWVNAPSKKYVVSTPEYVLDSVTTGFNWRFTIQSFAASAVFNVRAGRTAIIRTNSLGQSV